MLYYQKIIIDITIYKKISHSVWKPWHYQIMFLNTILIILFEEYFILKCKKQKRKRRRS